MYVGRIVGKDQAPLVIMAYVDDLLVATTSESALKALHDCTVSSCYGSRDWPRWLKAGHLRFLGRSIFRRPGSSALYMQVDPTYWMKHLLSLIEEGKHVVSRFAPHFGTGRKPTFVSRRTRTFSSSFESFVMVLSDSSGLVDFGQHAWNWSGTTV